MNEWASEWESEWVNEWIDKLVSEWVSEWLPGVTHLILSLTSFFQFIHSSAQYLFIELWFKFYLALKCTDYCLHSFF